jgi:invasion protein IalB
MKIASQNSLLKALKTSNKINTIIIMIKITKKNKWKISLKGMNSGSRKELRELTKKNRR